MPKETARRDSSVDWLSGFLVGGVMQRSEAPGSMVPLAPSGCGVRLSEEDRAATRLTCSSSPPNFRCPFPRSCHAVPCVCPLLGRESVFLRRNSPWQGTKGGDTDEPPCFAHDLAHGPFSCGSFISPRRTTSTPPPPDPTESGAENNPRGTPSRHESRGPASIARKGSGGACRLPMTDRWIPQRSA